MKRMKTEKRIKKVKKKRLRKIKSGGPKKRKKK